MTQPLQSGFGLSGTLSYTPDMRAYVSSDTYGNLDISSDLVEIQVTRAINSLSTAQLTVQNKYKKYDRRIQVMDRITIFLKRFNWMQVFSGYVTVAPFETGTPGAIEIQATCSLKKIQDTFWDVGAEVAQTILPGVLDTTQASAFSDTRIIDSIFNMLTKVANWPSNNIHVQAIPLAFIEQAINATKAISQQTALENLQALVSSVGAHSMTSGKSSGNPSTYGLTQNQSQNISYGPQLNSITPWRAGIIGTNDKLLFLKNEPTYSQYEGGSGHRHPYVCTGPFSGSATFQDTKDYWKNQRLLITSQKNPNKGIVVVPVGYAPINQFNISHEAANILGISAGDGIEVIWVDPSSPLGKVSPNQNAQAAFQSDSQYSNQSTLPSSYQASAQANKIVAIARQQVNMPYIGGGGHTSLGVLSGQKPKGFDCSGLVIFCLRQAGIQIGNLTAEEIYQEGPLVPSTDPLQPGDLVFFSSQPYSPPTPTGTALTIPELVWVAMTYGNLSRANANIAAGVAVVESGNVAGANYNPSTPTSSASFDRGIWQINTIHPFSNNSVFTIRGNAQAMASISGGGVNWDGSAFWGSDRSTATYTSAYNTAVSCIPTPPSLNPDQIYIPFTCSNWSSGFLPSLENLGGVFSSAAIRGGDTTATQSGSSTTQAEHVEIFVGSDKSGSGNDYLIGAEAPGLGVQYSQLSNQTIGSLWGTNPPLYYMGATRPTVGSLPGATDISSSIPNSGVGPYYSQDTSNSQNSIPSNSGGIITLYGLSTQGAISSSNAFNIQFTVPQFDTNSQQFYNSPRGFITDDTLLNSIQQVCGASMRHFMSAPNGDFVAWFPDYFGMYGTTPAVQIRDIEITDFRIYRSDDLVTTHVGISGDSTGGGLGQSVTLADWMATTGIVTLQQSEIMQMLWGTSYTAAQFDANNFLTRYGLRPYVTEVPTIRSHTLEFTFALLTFMQKWCDQYESTIATTFLPEVYPGMRVDFVDRKIEAYVEGVTHTCSRVVGFTTELTITAPTHLGKIMELTSPEALDVNNVKVITEP